jgi:hypothetical protein
LPTTCGRRHPLPVAIDIFDGRVRCEGDYQAPMQAAAMNSMVALYNLGCH